MNAHALTILEFPRALDVVAGFATSNLGADARARALARRPTRRVSTASTRASPRCARPSGGDDAWRPDPIPDLAAPLTRLRVEGSAWSGPDLVAGAILLRSSRRTQTELRDARRPAMVRAVLAPLLDALISHPSIGNGDRQGDPGRRRREGRRVVRRCAHLGASFAPPTASSFAFSNARWSASSRIIACPTCLGDGAQRALRDPRAARRPGRRRAASCTTRRRPGGTLFVEAAGGGGVRESDSRAGIRGGRRGRSHPSRAHRHAASAPRRDDRDARRARRAGQPFRARALRRRLPVRAGDASSTRATGFEIHDGRHPLLLAQGRERRPVRPRDGRRTSGRCSCPGRTPAARRCCSRPSG